MASSSAQGSAEITGSHFGSDWIVLADAGGRAPPLGACAYAAKALRDTLMKGWHGPIPEVISGHAANGPPSRECHMSIVPLTDIGLADATGRLMGLGVVLPRLTETSGIATAIRATLTAADKTQDDLASLRLTFGGNGVWRLQVARPESAVLQPKRYSAASYCWESITPLVYDKFPRSPRGPEAELIIAEACQNIGLPEPRAIEITARPRTGGVIEALGNVNEFGLKDWSLPQRQDGTPNPLNSRLRNHVRLAFSEPVSGPVILGAGRFSGLGLCLPFADQM